MLADYFSSEKLNIILFSESAYNTHDPGITILEMLIYAITDLSARMELPMEDILASNISLDDESFKSYFEAHEILPSNPLTINDYRRLFLDIKGVRNCWIYPYEQILYMNCKTRELSYTIPDGLDCDPENNQIKDCNSASIKGLYGVYVDFEIGADEKTVKEHIGQRFHEHRNLCEDLVEVEEIDSFEIFVCGHIELENWADKEEIKAKILWEIESYFSPSVRFLTLEEMVNRGYTTEEIFEGPLLEKGFIDPKELQDADVRSQVRLSDLINIIMRIEGIKVVKGLQIQTKTKDSSCNPGDWIICIPEGKKPKLCKKDSVFSFSKDVLPLNIDENKVEKQLKKLRENQEKEFSIIAEAKKELEIPLGVYRDINETTTIQNDFPETYGIGRSGLPAGASEKRKAKAKQLKGYLLIFDQILATYFAHLAKVKEVFAVSQPLRETYFTQTVQDIQNIEELFTNGQLLENPVKLTDILFKDLVDSKKRLHQILDHLIGLFSEKFGEYAFLMSQLYGSYADEKVLENKRSFLNEYREISKNRGRGFNYYRQPEDKIWNTDNVSGLQKRIARMTGITNYNRRNLSSQYHSNNPSGSFIEIYKLKGFYRWRFRDSTPKIILTSTEAYPSIESAENEIYLVLARVMETSEKEIESAFKKDSSGEYLPIAKDTLIGNLQVRLSESGRYSFNVINPEGKGSDWIIARQYSYYKTVADFKASILDFIEFLKNEFREEGMFVIENILLRPETDGAEIKKELFLPPACEECENTCDCFDPYSYRLTIVLPAHTMRFWNMDYRRFLENLIRQELPAHILPRICWIESRRKESDEKENNDSSKPKTLNQMEYLENAYREFLLDKTETGSIKDSDTLSNLIEALNNLHTVYPFGRLIDCKSAGTEGNGDNGDNKNDEKGAGIENKIVLGRTKL